MPERKRSLFDIVMDVNRLVESVEEVAPEDEAAFLERFAADLQQQKNKVDSIHWFILQCEAQVSLFKAEADRLSAVATRFDNIAKSANAVVMRAMATRKDPDGRPLDLQGEKVTFRAKKSAPKLEVTDEALVPLDFKNVSVTVPAPLFAEIAKALPEKILEPLSAAKRSFDIDNRSLLAHLKEEEKTIQAEKKANPADVGDVFRTPGARIADTTYSLIIAGADAATVKGKKKQVTSATIQGSIEGEQVADTK